MVDRYIPGFTNMLMQRMARGGAPRSRFADADGFMYDPEMGFMSEDMGGPAYVDFTQYAEPFPTEPMPAYAAPQDDFLARIQQAEAMAQAEAPVYTPDMGALDMVFQPENMGGPAYADMMPGAMPEQVSMLPFAPEQDLMADVNAVRARFGAQPLGTVPEQDLAADVNALRARFGAQPLSAEAPLDFSGLGGSNIGFGGFSGSSGLLDWGRKKLAQAQGAQAAQEPQRDPVTGLLLNAQGQPGFQFMTDRGRQAGYGKGNTGFLTADPNAQYRMRDERGKNRTVSEGTGVDALQNIYNLANQFNKEQGKKANWGIERLNPTTGRWERVAENDPADGLGVVGDIASVALPIGAAILTAGASIPLKMAAGAVAGGLGAAAAGRDPLTGAITTGLTAGGGALGGKLGAAGDLGKSIGAKTGAIIGSGLGATAGGLTTGQSLGQSLKGGALAAAGTFAGQQLGAPLRDLGIEIPGFNVAKNFAPNAPIVVTPTGGVAIPVGTGMGGGGGQPKPPPQTDVDGGVIDVTANRVNFGALPMFGAGLPITLPQGVPTTPEELARKQAQEREGDPIVVTNKPVVPSISVTAPLSYTPTITGTPSADPNEIVVTDTKKPVPPAPSISLTPPVIGTQPADTGEIVVTDTKKPFDMSAPLPPLSAVPTTAGGDFGNKQVAEQKKKPITVEDIQKYLKAAGLLSALLPGGGGGRGALNRIPAGFGSGFGSGFGGSLPRATLPGAATGFAQRALAPQDYYRYGYGPSQSFFDYVPQGAPNTSRAFTGYEQAQAREGEGFYLGGMAGGGYMDDMSSNSFAVNGPGTGRSDEIPAMLSDGEYVIDAETVALLGDGSSKAGANLLDQFRINVRKDKGRDLVKGDFSANAKRPEHYLKGGRT